MRKQNRIMIKAVAILLTLVLFTSAVVSGTLAKYVTQKSGTTSIVFEQYGITVKAWLDEDFKKATGLTDADAALLMSDNSASVTLNQIKMHPGCDYSKAVNFEITGTATVDVRIKIEPHIVIAQDDFNNYAVNNVGEIITSSTKVFPIGFTFYSSQYSGTTEPVYALKPWSFSTNVTSRRITDNIAIGLAKIIDVQRVQKDGTDNGGYDYVTKNIGAGKPVVLHPKDASQNVVTTVSINEFALGLHWPIEYEEHGTYTAEQLGQIEVALVNNGKIKKVNFSFTVSVEQTS